MTRIVEQAVAVTPQEAATVLAVARAQGRLVSATRPTPLRDGRVAFVLRLRDTPTRPTATVPQVRATAGRRGRGRKWQPATVAAAVLAGLVVLAAAGWGAWLAWLWVVAHRDGIIGGLLLIAVVLFALRKAGVCPGVVGHCRNCNH
jgi:hypothetical protein